MFAGKFYRDLTFFSNSSFITQTTTKTNKQCKHKMNCGIAELEKIKEQTIHIRARALLGTKHILRLTINRKSVSLEPVLPISDIKCSNISEITQNTTLVNKERSI